MKITYKFVNDLQLFLQDPNWQAHLTSIADKMANELIVTPEEKVQAKVKGNFSEARKQQMLEGFRAQNEKLLANHKKMLTTIEERGYQLGIYPFINKDDASLLLANIHILDSKELGFVPEAVAAVKSMLRENFQELYNPEVQKLSDYTQADEHILVRKFLANQEITVYDINKNYDLHPLLVRENISAMLADLQNNLTSFKKIQQDYDLLVEYSCSVLKSFSLLSYKRSPKWSDIAFVIASYFNSPDAIDGYIKEIDFSSWESIENSVFVGANTIPSISNLTRDELKTWQELNATHGKDAIKLFYQASDLKKAGFDIAQVKKEIEQNDEGERKDGLEKADINANLLKKAQDFVSQIKFTREAEQPEIAGMVREYNLPEDIFNKILNDILPKQKHHDNLPEIKFQFSIKGSHSGKGPFTFQKLPAGDIRGLFLGKMTSCCQFIGGDSEKCVIDGFTREDAGFYYITDKNGNIKAQSYAWIGIDSNGDNVLALDSVEYLPGFKELFLPAMKELLRQPEFQRFKGLYVGTGGKTPELEEAAVRIKAKDKNLYRYGDSEFLYKITENSGLAAKNNVEERVRKLDNFDEFMLLNGQISLDQIKSKGREEAVNTYKSTLGYYSVAFNILLNNGIEFNELIRYFEGGGSDRSFNNSDINLQTIHLLKYCTKIEDISGMATVGLNKIKSIHPAIIGAIPMQKLINMIEHNYIPKGFSKNNEQLSETHVEIIKHYVEMDDFSNASQVLTIFTDLHPKIIDTLAPVKLIKLAKQLAKLPYAYNIPKGFSKNNEQLSKAHVEVIKYYVERGNFSDAASVFDNLEALHPTIVDTLLPEQLIKAVKLLYNITIPREFSKYNEQLSKAHVEVIKWHVERGNFSDASSLLPIFANLHPAILDNLTPADLIKFAKQLTKLSYNISREFSKNNEQLSKAHVEVIKYYVERGNFSDASSLLPIFANLHPVILDNLMPAEIIKFAEHLDYIIPREFSKYNEQFSGGHLDVIQYSAEINDFSNVPGLQCIHPTIINLLTPMRLISLTKHLASVRYRKFFEDTEQLSKEHVEAIKYYAEIGDFSKAIQVFSNLEDLHPAILNNLSPVQLINLAEQLNYCLSDVSRQFSKYNEQFSKAHLEVIKYCAVIGNFSNVSELQGIHPAILDLLSPMPLINLAKWVGNAPTIKFSKLEALKHYAETGDFSNTNRVLNNLINLHPAIVDNLLPEQLVNLTKWLTKVASGNIDVPEQFSKHNVHLSVQHMELIKHHAEIGDFSKLSQILRNIIDIHPATFYAIDSEKLITMVEQLRYIPKELSKDNKQFSKLNLEVIKHHAEIGDFSKISETLRKAKDVRLEIIDAVPLEKLIPILEKVKWKAYSLEQYPDVGIPLPPQKLLEFLNEHPNIEEAAEFLGDSYFYDGELTHI